MQTRDFIQEFEPLDHRIASIIVHPDNTISALLLIALKMVNWISGIAKVALLLGN